MRPRAARASRARVPWPRRSRTRSSTRPACGCGACRSRRKHCSPDSKPKAGNTETTETTEKSMVVGRVWCAAATLCAMLAVAADIAPARLEGPDRARLIAGGAKREGSVTLYSSVAEKDLRRLVTEFERRHGIKVNVWRAGKDKVLQRVVTEAHARRYE